jgi:DeoR/GlpR family transcriptional regulator of sugar metabolism
MRGEEPPFDVRAVEAAYRKQRIGRVVAGLLAEGESVVIDSGTTALEVARPGPSYGTAAATSAHPR